MTNTNPLIETVEVPMDELLTFREFYDCFSDLLRDRIDADINSEAYGDIDDVDIDDIDELYVCPPEEIVILNYAMVGCPRPNVAEFRVEWERDFSLDEAKLTLVQ